MSSKTLGNLMRVCVISIAICGLFLCLYVIPHWGKSIITSYPEFSSWFWPWLIFAWLVALPCFAVLVLVWRIAGAVLNETVFTLLTAKWMKMVSVLLLTDAGILFSGNIIYLFLRMNHPSVVIFSMMGDIFIVALALFAAALSRYITKASILQEETDGLV